MSTDRLDTCYTPGHYDFDVGSSPAGHSYVLSGTVRDGNGLPVVGISDIATWSHASASHLFLSTARSQLLDSRDRFKPEKLARRPVQKMTWAEARSPMAGDLFSCSRPIIPGLNADIGYGGPKLISMKLPALPLESQSPASSIAIADVSPRIAVKKVLLLYERAQYREAANFIQRLSVGTFRIILRELPLEVFVEAMPHSLPIMESLYIKVFTSDGPAVDLKPLKPESVIMHMVKFFSTREDSAQNRLRRETIGPFTSGCKRILQVIVVSEPSIMKTIVQKQRALNKAVEGMGQHGLVGTTDDSLLPLHDALKLEFRRVVDTYKGALQKLEDLSLSNRNNPKSVAHGPAPVQASHQRQLSLRPEELQQRLIKNKSLLNVVEPTLDNHCLDILLGILQRRIQADKESLFQFTQLRKEVGEVNREVPLAPILMKYSRGCKQVLDMMKEIAKESGRDLVDDEDDSSDLSGYHSDSDSAIMTSGNSPYVTPRARYNFLSRSVRSKAIMRPSLLSPSGGSSTGLSTRSGFTDVSSSGGGSPQGEEFLSQFTTTTNTPTRPRHIKHKNQLHKKNSLVSSSSSSGNGSVGGGDNYQGLSSSTPSSLSNTSNCVECVTLVSVPDDQVITQGVNHRCAIIASPPPPPPPPSSLPDKAQSPPHHHQHHLHAPENQWGLALQQKEKDAAAGLTGGGTPALSSKGVSGDEGNQNLIADLRNEINQLRRGLHNANATIHLLEQRERNLLTSPRLIENVVERGSVIVDLPAEDTRKRLIREYGAIYAQQRVRTMDALDKMPELHTADELKSKLLFSVIVLAFRAVQSNLEEMRTQLRKSLKMSPAQASTSDSVELPPALPPKIRGGIATKIETISEFQPHEAKLLEAVGNYLLNSDQNNPSIRNAVQHVSHQLWTTLYDYPCLKSCDDLLKYIQTCVSLAWGLSNLTPPCVLEYETKVYMREMHVRHHSSDHASETIKSYMWPALLNGANGPCLHKGVVIT